MEVLGSRPTARVVLSSFWRNGDCGKHHKIFNRTFRGTPANSPESIKGVASTLQRPGWSSSHLCTPRLPFSLFSLPSPSPIQEAQQGQNTYHREYAFTASSVGDEECRRSCSVPGKGRRTWQGVSSHRDSFARDNVDTQVHAKRQGPYGTLPSVLRRPVPSG
jgi:hypothetical protein